MMQEIKACIDGSEVYTDDLLNRKRCLMHAIQYDIRGGPGPARSATGGHKNPPSAPPAIPPIIITPFNRQIPNPAIDPRPTIPGPPVVPPPGPDLRII
jgi:hypothetical protein